jgi:hypothetical protein
VTHAAVGLPAGRIHSLGIDTIGCGGAATDREGFVSVARSIRRSHVSRQDMPPGNNEGAAAHQAGLAVRLRSVHEVIRNVRYVHTSSCGARPTGRPDARGGVPPLSVGRTWMCRKGPPARELLVASVGGGSVEDRPDGRGGGAGQKLLPIDPIPILYRCSAECDGVGPAPRTALVSPTLPTNLQKRARHWAGGVVVFPAWAVIRYGLGLSGRRQSGEEYVVFRNWSSPLVSVSPRRSSSTLLRYGGQSGHPIRFAAGFIRKSSIALLDSVLFAGHRPAPGGL